MLSNLPKIIVIRITLNNYHYFELTWYTTFILKSTSDLSKNIFVCDLTKSITYYLYNTYYCYGTYICYYYLYINYNVLDFIINCDLILFSVAFLYYFGYGLHSDL